MNIRVWQYYRDNIDDIQCMHLVITVLLSLVLLSMGWATHAGAQKSQTEKCPLMKLNSGGSGSKGSCKARVGSWGGLGLRGAPSLAVGPWGGPGARHSSWWSGGR